MDHDNVVTLPGCRKPVATEDAPQPLNIPLDDVGACDRALMQMGLAVSLARATLARAPQCGDDAALDGVQQILAGLAHLLNE